MDARAEHANSLSSEVNITYYSSQSSDETEYYDIDSEFERQSASRAKEKGKIRTKHEDLWSDNTRKRRKNAVRIILVKYSFYSNNNAVENSISSGKNVRMLYNILILMILLKTQDLCYFTPTIIGKHAGG